MKKIIYIALPLLLVFTACNPMEDIYEETDKEIAKKNADEEYFSTRTLLEDNYTLIEDDYKLSTNENLRKYKSFSSRITAKDNLAQILNDKMFFGELGKEYKVTYKFYQGSLSYVKDYVKFLDKVSTLKTYELTKADYDSMGEGKGKPGKYDNFSDKVPASDYLPDFLKNKYPNAKSNDVIVVTYKFYSGSASDVTENWQFNGTVWAENAEAGPKPIKLPKDVKVYELVNSDYDTMGAPGKRNNFSDSSKPKDYLPTFLKVKFPYAKEGEKYLVIYKFYGKKNKDDERKSTFKKADEYTFTEGVWKAYSSVVNKTATMSYKVDKKTWEFVPPIAFVFSDEEATEKITLKDEDYAVTGDSKYKNFYLKGKTEEEIKSIELEKLSKILKTNYKVKVNTVYAITYKYYNGKGGEKTVKLKAVLEE
ncbi:MAG: hypothetical protein KGV44_10600 [Flavobacteriaceae bacterium]|nr:hypothetical protein [Flavobacteriaceae bacterium]